MVQTIQTALSQLEQRKNIRILFACEMGSQVFGLAHPESDLDVRFIYAHSTDWYLSLKNQKDTVHFTDGNLDLVGWDLRKVLQLLKKGNVTVLEWLQSATVYKEIPGFLPAFRRLAQQCYSPNNANFHYLALAKKFSATTEPGRQMNRKDLLMAIRASIYLQQIYRNPSFPQQSPDKLVQQLPQDAQRELRQLTEADEHAAIIKGQFPAIFEFVHEIIQTAEARKTTLPGNRVNMLEMDNFFKKMISNSTKKESRRPRRNRTQAV